MSIDTTTDPALRSWVPVAPGSDFPIQNLPFGAARYENTTRLYVAIGDHALDLHTCAHAGVLDGVAPGIRAIASDSALNALLAAGHPTWRALRSRLSTLLRAGDRTIAERCPGALRERADLQLVVPMSAGDYVDFYSSLDHAANVGKMFRPGTPPLSPNWRYLPIGYHGRTGTLVPDGTPVVRPRGQMKHGDEPPVYDASRKLDFELELGFVTGDGPPPPGSVPVDRARSYIFGMLLLNDWSARDLQAWENQPLGPFLAKSFATSLSPWIVTLDALEPFRVAGPVQEPPPLPHLATNEPQAYDIQLEVTLSSATMRAGGSPPQPVVRTSFQPMYWSAAQQLAHASSNGASVRAGDLFGSGTISNASPGSFGSMLELSWNGSREIALPGGGRTFLEDGDEVTMRAWCAGDASRAHIGFGTLRGTVVPALNPEERSRPHR